MDNNMTTLLYVIALNDIRQDINKNTLCWN